MSEQITSNKKNIVGLISSWIFGTLFALIGIIAIFSEPIPGIVMLIMAIVLLPPLNKLISKKLKIHLSSKVKIIVIIISFIILVSTVDTTKQQNNQPQNQQEQSALSTDNNEKSDEMETNDQQPAQQSVDKSNLVDEIEINNKIIRIGDAADDVFEITTDDMRISDPTIENGKVIQHYLNDQVLFDMVFERNETGNYYILTEIIIKDTNYELSETKQQSPVAYEIGDSSGLLITIFVPQETTDAELKELLNYFHQLKEEGELSKVMKGYTIIDIFSDKKLINKENYNNLIMDIEAYCSHIRASYSVDLSNVERASIGSSDCPNYEKIEF